MCQERMEAERLAELDRLVERERIKVETAGDKDRWIDSMPRWPAVRRLNTRGRMRKLPFFAPANARDAQSDKK